MHLPDFHSRTAAPPLLGTMSRYALGMSLVALAQRHRFLVLLAAALFTRLAMLALVDVQATLWSGDTRTLLAGGPTVPPAYPFFLRHIRHPLLIQSLLTIAVGWLVAVRFNSAAALLYVTSPFLILFEWRLLTESLAINLMVVSFLLAAFPRSRFDPWVAGIVMAIAILVRDTLLFLPLLFLLDRRAWPAIAACYVILAPVQISRASPFLSEGRMGLNLWIGTWETEPSWIDRGFAHATYPADAFRSPAERNTVLEAIATRDDPTLRRIAIDRLRERPSAIANWFARQRYMWLGTRTELHQLRPARHTLPWKATKAAFWLLNLVTLIAGITALAITRRWVLIAPIAYIAAIYLPFHSTEPRYSLFALPFFYAAIALVITSRSDRDRWQRGDRRSKPSRAAPAGEA